MDADIIVIGAGVIGLSIASKLALAGYSTILVEKEERFGTGISARNSEVIHAGIYYETGSLKGRLCLKGKELLYDFCEKYRVNYKRTGKLFLAVSQDEIPRIELIDKQAKSNGVNDLRELDSSDIKKIEPELVGSAALLSPSTGIVDTYGLMKTLLGIGESNGLMFAVLSPVENAQQIKGGWNIEIGGEEPSSITSRFVINSTGLFSTALSKKVFPHKEVPTLYPSKGCYLRYTRKSPLSHIVYPAIIPGKIEARVDATPDLDNQLRFGPNVEVAENIEDFALRDNLKEELIPAIQRYLPNIDISGLHPDTAGIRPKIYGPNDPVSDFVIEWADKDNNWLDLWGIESPGLTSCLAIADHVSELVSECS